MQHRRLTILFALITLFAFGVIVWYFFFSTPKSAPTLDGTVSPLSLRDIPARLGLIFRGDEPEQTTETEVTDPLQNPFVRIWDTPATGNTFVERQILREVVATSTVGTTTVLTTKTVRATTTVLMFVDRTTGYIYGYDLSTGKTHQITNTTVPGVYDAYLFASGDRVVMRYLDSDRKTITSMVASVPNVQEGRDPQPLLEITYLPKNISSVAVNSSLSALSFVVPTDNGSSFYTLTAKGSSRVADSPLSEWAISYGGNQLYATPKASAYVEGSTVSIPSFSPIINNKTGLVSVAGSNGTLLNSMWSQGGLVTFGANRGSLIVSSVKTLASKCISSTDPYFICGVPVALPQQTEGLPDDWYQGRVSFADTLMVVNAARGDAFTLYAFDGTYGDMDVTHVAATKKADVVSFIRKQDGTLFLLNTNLLSGNE